MVGTFLVFEFPEAILRLIVIFDKLTCDLCYVAAVRFPLSTGYQNGHARSHKISVTGWDSRKPPCSISKVKSKTTPPQSSEILIRLVLTPASGT